MALKIITPILFIIFISLISLNAQSAAGGLFGFTVKPVTVSSYGMGYNSVAFKNESDALTYNPSNLIYCKGLSISYYRFPLYSWNDIYPLGNFSAVAKIHGIGTFALEFRQLDYGEAQISSIENPYGYGEKKEIFERSISLGYALALSEELGIGGGFLYTYSYIGEEVAKNVLFNLGINYNPNFWDSKFNIGFSIMNLGTSTT